MSSATKYVQRLLKVSSIKDSNNPETKPSLFPVGTSVALGANFRQDEVVESAGLAEGEIGVVTAELSNGQVRYNECMDRIFP